MIVHKPDYGTLEAMRDARNMRAARIALGGTICLLLDGFTVSRRITPWWAVVFFG